MVDENSTAELQHERYNKKQKHEKIKSKEKTCISSSVQYCKYYVNYNNPILKQSITSLINFYTTDKYTCIRTDKRLKPHKFNSTI